MKVDSGHLFKELEVNKIIKLVKLPGKFVGCGHLLAVKCSVSLPFDTGHFSAMKQQRLSLTDLLLSVCVVVDFAG